MFIFYGSPNCLAVELWNPEFEEYFEGERSGEGKKIGEEVCDLEAL